MSKNKVETDSGNASLSQIELIGTAVSRGMGSGRALRLYGTKRQFARRVVDPEDVGLELERLRTAVEAAFGQLSALVSEEGSLSAGSRSIFDAHNVILSHSSLIPDIKREISIEHVSTEWAISRIADTLASKLAGNANANDHQKAADLYDIAERLLNALLPQDRPTLEQLDDKVVVATAVYPSTMVELARWVPRAIVTEHGGWTSHAFIMAREMGIPAVTSARNVCRNVADGDLIIVDGYSGRVVIRPSEVTSAEVNAEAPTSYSLPAAAFQPSAPLATADGREVVIRANVEHFPWSGDLAGHGAEGLGLVRSEYLFDLKAGILPTEEVQYAKYRDISERAAGLPVRLRVFDLNREQVALDSVNSDRNPALGLRAIRLMFANERAFRHQIRAMVRASSNQNITILLPMVADAQEALWARSIIDAECQSLNIAKDLRPKLGAMIEIPSAVMLIDEIVKVVDCICIGTNDLVQYLLAVDRDNESVARWYQTLHPAVLRAIDRVIRFAEEADIPAAVCGEMAASPFYIPLLIGLGGREFSMNLNAVGPVSGLVRGISYEEARQIALQALASDSAQNTEELLASYYHDRWPHLFSRTETGRIGSIYDVVTEK